MLLVTLSEMCTLWRNSYTYTPISHSVLNIEHASSFLVSFGRFLGRPTATREVRARVAAAGRRALAGSLSPSGKFPPCLFLSSFGFCCLSDVLCRVAVETMVQGSLKEAAACW